MSGPESIDTRHMTVLQYLRLPSDLRLNSVGGSSQTRLSVSQQGWLGGMGIRCYPKAPLGYGAFRGRLCRCSSIMQKVLSASYSSVLFLSRASNPWMFPLEKCFSSQFAGGQLQLLGMFIFCFFYLYSFFLFLFLLCSFIHTLQHSPVFVSGVSVLPLSVLGVLWRGGSDSVHPVSPAEPSCSWLPAAPEACRHQGVQHSLLPCHSPDPSSTLQPGHRRWAHPER